MIGRKKGMVRWDNYLGLFFLAGLLVLSFFSLMWALVLTIPLFLGFLAWINREQKIIPITKSDIKPYGLSEEEFNKEEERK